MPDKMTPLGRLSQKSQLSPQNKTFMPEPPADAYFVDMSRAQIILTKHYFEHGNIDAACKAAGYDIDEAKKLRSLIKSPNCKIGRFYQELCQDRIASTVITAEKKRLRVWGLVEWAVEMSEKGKPNDSSLALKCIDMLNKMDGHYAAVKIDSKQQIQKQTVSFSQKLGQPDNEEKLVEEEVRQISNG